MNRDQPKVVVIGGGTGSFAVLSGLKERPIALTALVNMADDGGSTGQLRDDFGVLPPGDVRKCLVAMSAAPEELRELFNYRYEDGPLAGHSFGNLFLSTVEKMTHDFNESVRIASAILRIRGKVMPITLDDVRLSIAWENHRVVVHGEGKIDVMQFGKGLKRPELYLEPEAHINPAAAGAIRKADLVVIAPGDVYTSVGALLIVGGVAEALRATKAKIIYLCNLVVKPGQTTGLSVADHAAEIERFAGGPVLDAVIYNNSQPPQTLLDKYAQAGELLVPLRESEFKTAHYSAYGRSLISPNLAVAQKGDFLARHRSYIRHDSQAVADAVIEFLQSQ